VDFLIVTGGAMRQDEFMDNENIGAIDGSRVADATLEEISRWKREAKAEDNDRYFYHVSETDQISRGDKYFVIGRKGSGKTAICEYFNGLSRFDTFVEKLSFKNFPFNELYEKPNAKYTPPNQFITIWKYLIYSTVCRLMIKNEAVDADVRRELLQLYGDDATLSRRVTRWVGQEFGLSLFGLSLKVSRKVPEPGPEAWVQYVDFLEDILLRHAGDATYFVLFDELDEDYRKTVESEQYAQYSSLVTSLFKAVQDIRTTFSSHKRFVFPVIFLRDDIYELVQDSDKNKWGDSKVDLDWDVEKLKRVIAFRISRAINPACEQILPFETAWSKVFGLQRMGYGHSAKKPISTFNFISRSTLLRPRDFVVYLQECAKSAVNEKSKITTDIVKQVDKAFSNYLRNEFVDELFAILSDIGSIFDTISQLRKWNFSIPEFEAQYSDQVRRGTIKEANSRFVVQVLFLFSVIGNNPRPGFFVFRYRNREAHLNFNERIVVHRGLFKSLQI
jgi:hypothetical protein